MLTINVHNITSVITHNEDTFSVVKLFVDGGHQHVVTLFFRAGKSDVVAEAIKEAIEGEE